MLDIGYSFEGKALGRGFARRLRLRGEDAQRQFEGGNFPEAILAVQEALELNAKMIALATVGKYPREHVIDERRLSGFVRAAIDAASSALVTFRFQPEDLVRAFLLARFWSQLYPVVKYGIEELGVGPQRIFGREEAELALHHLSEVGEIGPKLVDYYGPCTA
jgi:HEPN domain-containing protein